MHPCMIDPYGIVYAGVWRRRVAREGRDEGRRETKDTKNRTILSIYMGPGARAGHFP